MSANSSMIDVIMLGPGLSVQGGITTVVKEYLTAGLNNRVNLIFIPTLEKTGKLGRVSVFLKSVFKYHWALIKYPKAIIHVHLSQKGSFVRKFFIFLSAKLFGKRVLVHLHGSEFEQFMNSNALTRALTKFMFNHSSCVAVLSNVWNIKIRGFSNNTHIVTLYNPAHLSSRSPVSDGKIRVLFMGKLGERKGIYDLLKCIEQNQKDFRLYNTRFILAGDGDVERVRQIVNESKMTDLVEIPGWVSGEAREGYLKTSDIIILPSYNEQMPMSILEGMSYGYPIVATNVAGIPEMVAHGENGFLFNPGDIQAMRDSLVLLCQDAKMRDEMGKKSQQIIKSNFESSVIINQLVKIYETV